MDVGAAVAHLHEQGVADESIGIVGFCMGGRVTFLASLEFALGAAVGFYGGGIISHRFPRLPPLLERAGELKTLWLGLFGDLDAVIPVEDVEPLRTRLAELDVPTEVLRYATAEHGFHSEARPSFNAKAATDAWARTVALVRRPPGLTGLRLGGHGGGRHVWWRGRQPPSPHGARRAPA